MSSKRPNGGGMSNKRQKRRSESDVWEHFDETPDGLTAICKYCGDNLSENSNGGTSHLNSHLKSCQKPPTGDVGEPVTLESTHESRNVGFIQDKTWKDEVKKAIVAEIPFASSDCKKIWYSLSGLADIEKETCAYYELEKEKLAIELKNLPSRVSFSFEIVKELGYISITAHFINGDFNLVRKLIGFKKLTDVHSRSCIVDAIRSCISDWKLEDKIFTFVGGTDNIKECLLEIFSSKMLLDGKFIEGQCFKEAVSNLYSYCIGPLCYHENSNIDKFVKHVKAVPSRMAIFNKIAGEKGLIPINIDWLNEYAGCCWDVDSNNLEHWKPAVKMFKEALTYKDVLNQYAEIAGRQMTVQEESLMLGNGHSGQLNNIDFSSQDTHVEADQCPLSELNMCSIDWKRVEEAVLFSDLLLKVIDGLSNSDYPTSNLYFPYMVRIEDLMSNYYNKPIEIETSDIEETYDLTEEYDKLLHGNLCDLYEIANALDPRYKIILSKCYWKPHLGEHWNIVEHVESCEKIFCAYANDEMDKGSPQCIEYTNTQQQGPPSDSVHIIGKTISEFYKCVKEIKNTKKSELYKYLGDELVDLDDASFHLLSWWRQNRSQYPVLSRMARDILAVPTSVHSIEGIISSDFRLLKDVSPQLAEAVICSKDWIVSNVQSVPETGN